MTWLWILGAILLFLAFLLFVGVKIHVSYAEEIALSLSVLGIRIRLLPKKKRKITLRNYTHARHKKRLIRESESAAKKERRRMMKENKKRLKKATKKVEKKKKLPPEEKKKSDGASVISILLSVVGDILDKFFGMLGVEVVRIRITVGGPDAAATAIAYGAVSQGVAYLLELLSQKTVFRCKDNEHVSVTADFLSQKTTADVSIVFTLRLWNFISIAFTFLTRFIKEKIRRESVQT